MAIFRLSIRKNKWHNEAVLFGSVEGAPCEEGGWASGRQKFISSRAHCCQKRERASLILVDRCETTICTNISILLYIYSYNCSTDILNI